MYIYTVVDYKESLWPSIFLFKLVCLSINIKYCNLLYWPFLSGIFFFISHGHGFISISSDNWVGNLRLLVAPNSDTQRILSQCHNIFSQVCFYNTIRHTKIYMWTTSWTSVLILSVRSQ